MFCLFLRNTDRSEQIASLESRIAATGSVSNIRARIYPYLHKIAAAGVGFYFDDIPTDTIEAPYREHADFIIGVSGDSMEPTYYDGDLVYVQKQQVVETGDIGIFVVDGECFIKEAGENGLVSHNPKYRIISGQKEINCVGKVPGKGREELRRFIRLLRIDNIILLPGEPGDVLSPDPST